MPSDLHEFQVHANNEGNPDQFNMGDLDLSALFAFAAHDHTENSGELMAAYTQFCERVDAGEEVDSAAFCRQFPAFEKSLADLIGVHQLAERATGPRYPRVGDFFAGFHLLEELGVGSVSKVFRAKVPALGDRQVVVKISTLADVEAKIQGTLEHPNIVPANWIAQEQDSNLAAVMMPYQGRATLEHLLGRLSAVPEAPVSAHFFVEASADPLLPQNESLPLLLEKGTYFDGVCFLAEQMARALVYLHSQNILHRDLKPSNVLVTPAGRALLMDFNLALEVNKISLVQGGTLQYMAPEQLRAFPCPAKNLSATPKHQTPPTLVEPSSQESSGQSQQHQPPLDARADLYAFGVILYEMLARQHPFCPSGLKLSVSELYLYMREHQPKGSPPLGEYVPHGEKSILDLADRCLAYRAEDRPQSAVEVADILTAYLAQRQEQLDPQPVPKPNQVVRGRKLLVAVSLVACVLLASGFAAARFLPPATPPAEERRADAYQLGVQAYHEGRFPQAIEHFTTALNHEPENAHILFARARASQQWGETKPTSFAAALTDYNALEKHPAFSPRQQAAITACIAFCLQRTRQTGDSQGDIPFSYKKAIKGGFETPEVLCNLGCYHNSQGATDQALAILTEALLQADKLSQKIKLHAIYHNRAVANFDKCLKLLPAKKQGQMLDLFQAHLEQGQADVLKALEGPTAGAKLYYAAAGLFALTDPQAKEYLDAKKQTYRYLEQAIGQGQNPKNWFQEPQFTQINTEGAFQKLLETRPANSAKVQTRPLLDPLKGKLELP